MRRSALTWALTVAASLLLASSAAAATPFTWTAANIDATNIIGGISCPTATMCVATDASGNVIASDDPAGGTSHWAFPENLTGTAINDISCPTTTLCVAVDQAGFAWTSTSPTVSGTWTPTGAAINPAGALRAISCPSTALCVAAGAGGNVVYATNPTAGPWTASNIDGANILSSISCATTTLCVTGDDAGNELNTTTPTGTWSAAIPISPGVVQGMSCPTTTFCVAVDDSGNAFPTSAPTGGAGGWPAVAGGITSAFANWVSCPTASLCVATDSAGHVISSTAPTTTAWDSVSVGVGQVRAVSCATVAFCAAVDDGGNVIIGIQPTLNVVMAGTGSGAVTGNGISCPGTCSKIFSAGSVVSLTATPAADGSVFTGWGGACSGTGTCNLTLNSNRAVIATFDTPAPTAGPSSTPGGPAGPVATPAASSPLPPPVAGKTANATPISGVVLVRTAGSKRFVPLTNPEQVQFGTVFDARKGVVQIVISDGHGGFYTGRFSEGVFLLVAAKGGFAELRLVGGNFKGCPRAARGGAAVASGAKGRSVRHLWGEASGKFRTKGRFSTATVRGTKWLTDDRCKGTLTRVAIGAVTVRDLVNRKSVPVKAPKSYFAAAKRR